MTYWRMQLHPNDSEKSIKYTSESLSFCYIGLAFFTDPGDLEITEPLDIHQSNNEYLYWQFAKNMDIEDIVAIFSHNRPFALAKVCGKYNYIKYPMTETGLWFNHFRKVENVRYFLDEYNYDKWDKFFTSIPPTQMTIQKHTDANKEIYQFIDSWYNLKL
jgi:hypothetical protein